jgi:hypothetical protein
LNALHRFVNAAIRCAAFLALVVTTGAAAGGEESCDFGSPHPAMPAEFRQYDFLIGDFEVRIRVWLGDHWSEQYQKARWIGRYILGGRAVSEEWYPKDPADDPDGPGGVNIRMYDPHENRWKLMWMRSDQLIPTELRSQVREDGRMYLWRVYPTADDRKIWFETYDKDHWARLDYQQSDSGEGWVPKYKLEAYRHSGCQ